MRLVALNWRELANPAAGGAEVLIDRLLTGFSERGHDVTLVCGGPGSERRYKVVKAGGTYSQYLLAPVICVVSLRDVDVLIDAENGVPFFSPLWRRGPSICLVNHVHTDQWETRFPKPLAAIFRTVESRIMPVVYRNRDFVAISQSTAHYLEEIGIDSSRIHIIEPGIDVPVDGDWPKLEEPQFLSLSRMVPHKRIDLLLRAWEIASAKIPGRLILAGDGPELTRVRRLASVIPRVEVVGRVTDEEKTRLLGESWALISASHHEGWGLSVLEAAAMGTTTLAVDAPGIRDAIVDGVTGILVRTDNEELDLALADSWVTLANDKALLERLGTAARKRSAEFGWQRTIDAWLDLIAEVAESGEGPQRPVNTGLADNGANLRLDRELMKVLRASADRPEPRSWGGLKRSAELFRGFQSQYDRPDDFYTLLADDTVALVERYARVRGQRVIDIGGGPGYFAKAFRRAGATSFFVEPFWEALTDAGRSLGYGIIGDGMKLPIADGAMDISHSSNVLEHVPNPKAFFAEMLRVVRPGGLMFLAFTNWFSPFGGHETAPWHYFGGKRAAMRYERKVGYAPKNCYGSSLFRLDIGEVLSWARSEQTADLIDAFPRYYPEWTKGIVRIPGLREFVTWNLVIILRRR